MLTFTLCLVALASASTAWDKTDCLKLCTACDANNRYDCSACVANAHLFGLWDGTARCMCDQGSGYTTDGEQCAPCDPTCKSCGKANDPNSCASCSDNAKPANPENDSFQCVCDDGYTGTPPHCEKKLERCQGLCKNCRSDGANCECIENAEMQCGSNIWSNPCVCACQEGFKEQKGLCVAEDAE